MCGIAGVCLGDAGDRAVADLLEASFLLQHRGQDACGIATSDHKGGVFRHRDLGLAAEVFSNPRHIQELDGNVGLLHMRYGTSGGYGINESQPLHSPVGGGIFLCHNGNLINTWELEQYLRNSPYIYPHNTADTGLLISILALRIQSLHGDAPDNIKPSTFFAALTDIYTLCKGSFACLAMFSKGTMVAFRDAHGIKPLVYGERKGLSGEIDYMFASESVALDKLGFSNIRDVQPGEAILIQPLGRDKNTPRLIRHQVVPMLSYTPDIFEYVYLARPESVMDGISVHLSRQHMGAALAKTIAEELGSAETESIDVIIPVPDTSCTSALSVSQELGKPYSHGIVKNRYIFRTFIMPNEVLQRSGVLRKLNAIKHEFAGRNVVVVDDSIVRGTTSREVVLMAKAAGANKVIMTSSSPAIRYNHIHGINLAENKHLIAHGRTNSEICKYLGADHLVYLSLPKLIECCLKGSLDGKVTSFEVGVFSGTYVTGSKEDHAEPTDGRPYLPKVPSLAETPATC